MRLPRCFEWLTHDVELEDLRLRCFTHEQALDLARHELQMRGERLNQLRAALRTSELARISLEDSMPLARADAAAAHWQQYAQRQEAEAMHYRSEAFRLAAEAVADGRTAQVEEYGGEQVGR